MPPSSPGPDSCRALLKRLAPLSPPLFVLGGLAEDALLFHRITGPHADLDVLVTRQRLNQHLQHLAGLGLAGLATDLQASPGRPLTLSAGAGYPPIEIWVSNPEPGGGYSLDVPGQPPPSRYRVFLPADTFQYPATTIEGVTIQTISPLALYQLRAVSALTRSGGEKWAQDLAMQEQLRRALLGDREERELAPRLVKCGNSLD